MAKYIITGVGKGQYGTSNPLTESNLTELGNVYQTSDGGGTGGGSSIYPISLGFATGTGLLTMGMYGSSNLSENLDGRYSLLSHTQAASTITSGVFDYARLPFGSLDVSNWNTAHGWGNHATMGYLTAIPAHNHNDIYDKYENWNLNINNGQSTFQVFTGETVNLVAGTNMSITHSGGNVTFNSTGGGGGEGTTYLAGTGLSLVGTTFSVNYGSAVGTAAQGNDSRINNGQTAFGWGNHASAGYLTALPAHNHDTLYDKYTNWNLQTNGGSSHAVSTTGIVNLIAGTNMSISQSGGNITFSSAGDTGGGGATYLAGTGLTLTGSTFAANFGSVSGTIAQGNDSRINNGQTAFGWGNHASAGYLTSLPAHNHDTLYDNYNYWRLGANASYTNIVSTDSVNFVGSGASSVSRVGNTITISSTDTNTNTTYSAGTGITLTGTTFSVVGGTGITADAGGVSITAGGVGATQLNVTGNGTTAQYLRSDGDGSFTWATPTDTNTTYSAGTGITLSGTTFSNSDTGSAQDIFKQIGNSAGTLQFSAGSNSDMLRFAGSGASSVSFNSTTKTITISSTDTNTNTTYSAGTGITLSGTTFSVVGGTGITADAGGVSITAGGVGATQLNVTGNGTTSQWLRSDGDGSFTWATPPNTTYSAGTGLSLSGTTFTNTAPDQTVSLTGGGATSVTGTYPNFTISSTDTNTNTTYSAGTGITLTGTTFSVVGGTGITADAGGVSITANGVSATQLNVVGNGTTAQYLRSDGDGSFTWATPTDTNTTYSAGTGLSLSGTTFTNTAPHIATNLGASRTTTAYTITSSTGANTTIDGATTSLCGLITTGTQSFAGAKTFTSNLTAPAFYETSLRKWKENIEEFQLDALTLVNGLDIVTFDRIDGSVKNKIGIIADDTSKEFLNDTKDAVDLYKTIFIQAKAIQELNSKVERLESLVEKLLGK